MKGKDKGRVLITRKNLKRIRQEIEDSALRVWRTSNKIVPKMILDFRVHFQEIYASTVGKIFFFTPFFRGRTFTEAVLMHEYSHWSVFPVDLWKSIHYLFLARKKLAEEIHFTPKKKETDLYEEVEDWEGFPYSVQEFSFCMNLLGDYLVNSYIHDFHPILFKELWKFLYKDGSIYEKQKKLERDSSFFLYLSVYPEIFRNLERVKLKDKKAEKDRDKVVEIVTEIRNGRMSKVFGLKELVKIFHPYLLREKKAQGKGKEESGESKCPKCGGDTFEVIGYFDERKKKWVKI